MGNLALEPKQVQNFCLILTSVFAPLSLAWLDSTIFTTLAQPPAQTKRESVITSPLSLLAVIDHVVF